MTGAPTVLDSDPPALAIGAVAAVLVSPNEADSNGEPANVVDGLFAIARAIDRLADAISGAGSRPFDPFPEAPSSEDPF